MSSLLKFVSESTLDEQQKDIVTEIISRIQLLKTQFEDEAETTAKLAFIESQLQLLTVEPKRRRFSKELYAWSAGLHSKSAAAYKWV